MTMVLILTGIIVFGIFFGFWAGVVFAILLMIRALQQGKILQSVFWLVLASLLFLHYFYKQREAEKVIESRIEQEQAATDPLENLI